MSNLVLHSTTTPTYSCLRSFSLLVALHPHPSFSTIFFFPGVVATCYSLTLSISLINPLSSCLARSSILTPISVYSYFSPSRSTKNSCPYLSHPSPSSCILVPTFLFHSGERIHKHFHIPWSTFNVEY